MIAVIGLFVGVAEFAEIALHAGMNVLCARRCIGGALRRGFLGLIEPLHQRRVSVVQRLGEPVGDIVRQIGPRQDVAP